MQPLTEDEIRRILVVIPQDTPEGIHTVRYTRTPEMVAALTDVQRLRAAKLPAEEARL